MPANERGARLIRVHVPVQPDEMVAENNERTQVVVVDDQREKILYLEGEPRFELKFIRRALEADENIQLVTLLRSAKDKYLRLSVDDSLELASGFPRTREELFKYRAIVLGSIEASFFTVDQLRMLADFVSVRGGGLLVLGGRRALAEGGYAGTPLADALPVELGPAVPRDSGATEVVIAPTTAGVLHPATQLAATDSATATLWRNMPPLTTVNVVGRPKPKPPCCWKATWTGSAPRGRRCSSSGTAAARRSPSWSRIRGSGRCTSPCRWKTCGTKRSGGSCCDGW